MTALPSGTVTFLFSDIEGSTQLWEQYPGAMQGALVQHDVLTQASIEEWGGVVIKNTGDGFYAVFSSPIQGLQAALDAQRRLFQQEWDSSIGELRVRIGLHTGTAELRGGDYYGRAVNRTSRLCSVAHGGQVLLSETTAALVRDEIPDGTSLMDLGRHRLKDIEEPETIKQLVIEDLPSDYPPLRSLEAIGAYETTIEHNLPVQSTPFVGRLPELTAVEALLEEPGNRLVTIVGPGGMGKTRLAIAFAERQLESKSGSGDASEPRYPDGVFFVSLDELNSADQIVPQLAHSLGLQLTSSTRSAPEMVGPDRNPKEQVLDYLSNKKLLLVMDNFEHLLDSARLLVEIHECSPEITILSTSRERLGLRGEQLYPLHGLRSPEEDGSDISPEQLLTRYSASRLFIQAAKRYEPDYTVNPGDIRDLARLCYLVDGLPLALELAAGWAGTISMSETVTEISKSMGLLETDMVDVPERHRSMEAVFQSTWSRLEPEEQELFSQLCIFSGGFTRQAAFEVTGATLRQLGNLVNKSLLLYDRRAGRYRIHRLLRQFGHDELAKDPAALGQTRERYCAFFCEAMARWGDSLKATRQREALREMESDSQNIEAAWNWAVEQGYIACLKKSMEALHTFFVSSARVSQLDEAYNTAGEMLSKKEDPSAKLVLAKLLARKGWFLEDALDLPLVEHSLDLIDEVEAFGEDVRADRAFALFRKAYLILNAGGVDESAKNYRHSLSIYQELGDRWGIATVLVAKGHLAFRLGNFEEAGLLFDQSLQLRRAIGDSQGELNTLQALAGLARYTGELDKARELEEHCISLHRQEANQLALASSLNAFSATLFWLGEFQKARAIIHEYKSIFIKHGLSHLLQFEFMDEMNALFLGDYECLDRFDEIKRSINSASDYGAWVYWLFMSGALSVVKRQYTQARGSMAKALEIVRETQMWHEFGAYASWLSMALWRTGEHRASKRQIHEALKSTIEMKATNSLMHILPAAALILVGDEQLVRAVEVYEVALTFPHVANAKLFEDVIGSEITTIANSLDPFVAEKARQKGRERDPWAMAEELLANLETEMTAV